MDGDRLSSLPDEILSHILSFLETKQAVGTAVLSRRWKDIWTRVSNLDLDNYSRKRYHVWARDLGFSSFVDRVLSGHQNLNSLRRFRLSFAVDYRRVSPKSWSEMELNAESQLEEIDVRLPPRMEWVPESFYTLKNLKVLKLFGVVIMAAHGSVFLPSLMMLKLSRVGATDGESLSRFISGCPVLETAHLEQCYCSSEMDEKHKVTASLPFLKSLTVIASPNFDATVCSIVIEAPSLEHLELENFEELEIVGDCPLSCLESVRLDIREECNISDCSLIVLFTQISNAKEMRLSRQTLALLSVKDVQLPVLPKLIHLTIEASGGSRTLRSLLNSACKLRTLFIVFYDNWGPTEWVKSKPVCTPECLLSSLEQVEINELLVVRDGMEMVRYLLKAGVVLKKVNLNLHSSHDDKGPGSEIRKKLAALLKLPRGSSVCEVRIFHHGVEMHLDTEDVIDICEYDTDDDNTEDIGSNDEEEFDTSEVEADDYDEVDISGEGG